MANKMKKEGLTVNKLYLGILAAFTVVFVVALVVVLVKGFDNSEFANVKKVNAENFTTQKLDNTTATTYYVLIFEKDNDENQLVDEKVKEYAAYASQNMSALPIFVLEYSDSNASLIKDKLGSSFDVESDFPCLVTISNGSASGHKKTVSSILQTLEDAMNK